MCMSEQSPELDSNHAEQCTCDVRSALKQSRTGQQTVGGIRESPNAYLRVPHDRPQLAPGVRELTLRSVPTLTGLFPGPAKLGFVKRVLLVVEKGAVVVGVVLVFVGAGQVVVVRIVVACVLLVPVLVSRLSVVLARETGLLWRSEVTTKRLVVRQIPGSAVARGTRSVLTSRFTEIKGALTSGVASRRREIARPRSARGRVNVVYLRAKSVSVRGTGGTQVPGLGKRDGRR